jgi:large repetitive protein
MLGSLLFYQEASASGFDLEVSVSVPNPNPAIYTNVPVTVTAKNTGTVAGTGIQIRVGVCGTDAFSFVQQNQLVWANTGSSATGTWDWLNQRWAIPSLAPGQTATLNFTLFTLTTDARSIQVFTQASSPDVDSSPGNLPTANGLWVCTANEDDEAVLTLNGGAVPCSITATVTNIQCNDNGTPTNPADDKFSFTLMATNPAPSTGFHLFIPQVSQAFNGTYGSPMTIQNIAISTGNLTLNLTDNVTGGCSASINITAPPPCSTNGSLPDFELVSFFAVQPVPGGGSVVVEPNDPVPAGTTLNFPDHFAWLTFPVIVPTFDVVIAAYLSTDATLSTNDVFITSGTRNINAAVQNYGFTEGQIGIGVIPASTPPGNYFLILKHDATDLIAESNEANNFEATPIVVTTAPSGRIDLSLSMNQQTPNPVVYSHYLTTLTIANDGQEPATGVKVKWVKPAGVVYTGGNEFVASQGSFNPNGDQVWTVGTIPNAGVASLTVSYFLLQNGAPSTYAQVIAAGQTDEDSQPNNGTPPTVNEDDEAATAGSLPPITGCAAINITPGTNSLTIAGATAPHVLIKVFNPNWTLNFQCLDNCANPLTINNLNAGTYHVQVKLINNGWGEICYLEQDVIVSSFGPGGGTGIARPDDRHRLVLDRFYPSPTSYQVTVDVFSPVEQAATLDFYDQLGRAVHSMKVQLDKGNNPVQVLVFDWKSGSYNVIARGEETGLPAYGRFLKVWEE